MQVVVCPRAAWLLTSQSLFSCLSDGVVPQYDRSRNHSPFSQSSVSFQSDKFVRLSETEHIIHGLKVRSLKQPSLVLPPGDLYKGTGCSHSLDLPLRIFLYYPFLPQPTTLSNTCFHINILNPSHVFYGQRLSTRQLSLCLSPPTTAKSFRARL